MKICYFHRSVKLRANMASKPLAGMVGIVTGATRGIGKGIALQLGEKGAKVYITGRTLKPQEGSRVGGSLVETVSAIEERGGNCIPVLCDHSKDNDVQRLFDQVKQENSGALDILVNNASGAVPVLFNNQGVKFWELPHSTWDEINNAGLRDHFMCAAHAARLMVPRKRGLIVNISGLSGQQYLSNIVNGICKAGNDKMAADCGWELKTSNVAFVSLWPAAVCTEETTTRLQERVKNKETYATDDRENLQELLEMFLSGETPDFIGKCVTSLATDPELMDLSGKGVLTYELGKRYGLSDLEGHFPMDYATHLKLIEMLNKCIAWIYGSRHAKTSLREYADSKGPDQPAQPRSLIRAFLLR